jgi:Formin Homology 2 Domain/Subunit CCDC53 of WASH complex
MRSSSSRTMAPEQSPGSRHRKREQTLSRSMAAAGAMESRPNAASSSRRRNMGLFKYSTTAAASKAPTSSVQMHRTREHAKQIAMALSQDLSASSSFADFGSAFGGGFSEDASVTESTTQSHEDFFFVSGRDPFSAAGLPAVEETAARQRRPTAPQTRSRRTVQDMFSDPGGAALDWPGIVRVSALSSPVTRKAPSTASSSSGGGGMTSTRPTKTPERRPNQSSSTLSPTPVHGAAARRLMRQQLRKDDPTTTSPYGIKRTDSSSSSSKGGSTGQSLPNSYLSNKPTDHVAHYTHQTAKQPSYSQHRNPVAPSHRLRSESSSGSSAPTAEVNLFDTTNKAGFSFDAFGLDGAEMQREVNEAMHDLAGSHPHISLFLQDPKDDFAFGRWDDAQSNTSNQESAEGFVDGFRVHKQHPLPMQHVRESPTRSERSSLTSESLEANGPLNASSVNMFKQQAGFHASNKPRKVVRPSDGPPDGVAQNGERALPHIPKLDAPGTKKGISPRNRSYGGGGTVEFFGEESSSSSNDDVHTSPRHAREEYDSDGAMEDAPASDEGVTSDMDLPSDVGMSSRAGADNGHLPSIDNKEKWRTRRNSPSVRTESTAATTAVEEKKEEERPVLKTVGKLRSQWEAKDQILKREAEQKLMQRQHVPSTIPKEHIARLQTQLGDELLTPEILTAKHSEIFAEPQRMRSEDSAQKQRAMECLDQRTSLSSIKERLKSPVTRTDDPARRMAKSEGGAAVRHSSVSAILSNLQRKGLADDSLSDTNDPLMLASANDRPLSQRLVNGSSAYPPWSPSREPKSPGKSANESRFESQAMKLMRQQNDALPRQKTPTHLSQVASNPKSPARTPSSSTVDPPPAPKQLTYRERRELELRRQREEEEEQNRSQGPTSMPQERDVASLIKQRIAANKKNLDTARVDRTTDEQLDISSLRNRLRPAPIEVNHDAASDDGCAPSHSESSFTEPVGNFKSCHFVNAHESNECFSPSRSQSGPTRPERIDLDLSRSDFSPPSRSRNHMPPHFHSSPREQSSKALAVGEETEQPALRSPPSQNIASSNAPLSPRESQSDWVVSKPRDKSPASKPVVASAAVSHMLMLQQLQQRQGNVASPVEPVSPKHTATRSMAVATNLTENEPSNDEQKSRTPKATMMMLNAFLAGRESLIVSDRHAAPPVEASRSDDEPLERQNGDAVASSVNALPALKDDPKFSRYFKMLSVGMPMEVVKHAMTRDGLDPSVMDGDHNKPAGIPLKDDPEYSKYFRMLKIGLPMEAVKHAMERDGLDSAVMDQDHELPVSKGTQSGHNVPKEQDSHRRARLHWKTLRKVTSNSLWAQIDQDNELNIEIDEEEFQELFQAEKAEVGATVGVAAVNQKRGSAVCVIDSKRANNGGIILARLKMTHDDLADAVDRIDEQNLTAEQIENIIEYLPSKEERKALETYMLEGGQDAAEKFEGLCECEKFMVSMMTVKHAKRKVSALLFKLQFESCIRDIQKEAYAVEQACEELSSSVRLRQLLGIVLTFGNRLNTAGNGQGKAGAFTLDSLLKLNQAKAFDKKTTFLHYIILIVQRNNELLLNFKDDLPTVFASEKIFWDQCVADLEEVENQLENVRKMALYQAHQSQNYRTRRKSKREDPDESFSDADDTLTLEEEVEALRSTPIGLFTLSAIKYVSALRDKVENTKLMFARLLEYFGEEERQLQPHELFSIIVTFSRDFDKAKEQVLANEKFKQREERKRQANSNADRTPSRPSHYSPAVSEKKSVDTLKLSNLQPNMSPILSELKVKGKRIADAMPETSDVSYQRQQVIDHRVDTNYSMAPPQPPQSRQRHSDNSSIQRKTVSETPGVFVSPQAKDASLARKSPSNFLSKSNVEGTSPNSQITEAASNEFQDDASQVTTETLNSSLSTSSLAQRAKERMRRHRAERLPSIPATPPAQVVHGSKKTPKTSEKVERESPATPRSDESKNASAQILSPRSSVRLKRRAEQRIKARRSNNASIQL